MKQYAIILIALAAIAIATTAQAASSDSKGTCSSVLIMGPANSQRIFVAYNNEEISGSVTGCNTGGTKNPIQVNSGSSIDIKCLEATTGVTPPGPPDTNGIIIRGYHDNEGFPDSTGQKWATTFTSCLTEQTFTRYCTNDGTSTGTPIWGPIRIYIRAVRTAVLTYDDSSESADSPNDGTYGIFICNPSISSRSLQLGGTGTDAPSPAKGGDVIFSNWTLGSANQDSTNTISNRIKCTPGTGTQATQPANSNPRSISTTIQTPNFQQACYIYQNVSITRNIGVSGWTTTPYATFTTAPAGVTIQNSSRDAEYNTTTTVSYQGNFTSIINAKLSGGANQTCPQCTFIISVDNEFVTAKGLKDPRGNLVQGATVICQRTRPDLILESAVTMGTTNSNGDSPEQSFAALPPLGQWKTECRSNFNGNYASYNITYNHTTTLSANTGIAIVVNTTANGTNWDVNVTMVLRQFDSVTGQVVRAMPDNIPQLTVLGFNRNTEGFDDIIQNKQSMIQLDGITSEYYRTFTATTTNLTPAAIYINFNLTGISYLGSQGYTLTTNNLTAITNGTFTGNFIGNFTALGFTSPPEDRILNLLWLISFLFLAGIAMLFATKNPFLILLGEVVFLIAGGLVLSYQTPLGDSWGYLLLIVIGLLILGGWRLLAIFNEFKNVEQEE